MSERPRKPMSFATDEIRGEIHADVFRAATAPPPMSSGGDPAVYRT